MEYIDEIVVSKAIIETYTKELLNALDLDVAIVGGGPAGLTAAYKLASYGRKVALFERKLSVGGGMWGGGIGFNIIVVQEEGKKVLDEIGLEYSKYTDGYYTADSVQAVAALIRAAGKAGAKIFNLSTVEDVMVRDGRITGIVLNHSAIEVANLHVDPITIRAKYVVEATGHPLEVLHKVQEKSGLRLNTPTGKIMGEGSMNAPKAELSVVENTTEIVPGMYVVGMAANAAMGSYRMGPIFGGMLLSGLKAAAEINEKLS